MIKNRKYQWNNQRTTVDIMSDLHAALLADALNKYFCGLVEENSN